MSRDVRQQTALAAQDGKKPVGGGGVTTQKNPEAVHVRRQDNTSVQLAEDLCIVYGLSKQLCELQWMRLNE